MRSSTWRGTPVSAGITCGKSSSCSRKGREVLRAVAGPIAADEVGLKEKRGDGHRRRRLAFDAVIKGAADNGQVALVERQQPSWMWQFADPEQR